MARSIESPQFNNPEKVLSPEQYAILIEKDIIEKYTPLLNQDIKHSLSPLEMQKEWIKKYADSYRDFFINNQNKIIELYRKEPLKAIKYIETNLEGHA